MQLLLHFLLPFTVVEKWIRSSNKTELKMECMNAFFTVRSLKVERRFFLFFVVKRTLSFTPKFPTQEFLSPSSWCC